MNRTTYLYGCRSGIQKAIRRNDLNLAKTCFESLWEDKESRRWLQWRTAILVNEDVWYMAGEFAKFLGEVSKTDIDGWWEFIRTLVIVDKAKDTEGLLYYAKDGMTVEARENPEGKWMREILDASKDPAEMANMTGPVVAGYRDLTDYEKRAVKLLWSRSRGGGMSGDRRAMVAGMVLIATRRLPSGAIKAHIDFCKRSYAKKPVKKLKQLPWYVFDMHTQPGLIAMNAWAKKWKPRIGIDYTQLSGIWFKLESAKVGRCRIVPLKDRPTWIETMWWPLLVDRDLRTPDYSGDQIRGMWNEFIRMTLEDKVKWAIMVKG